MAESILIKKNAYYDSVTLMALSGKIKELAGVSEAVVAMATPMNKELLQTVGLFSTDAAAATEADLIIAIRADNNEACTKAQEAVDQLLAKQAGALGAANPRPAGLAGGLSLQPESNLAIISVPGRFAAREAEKALTKGLHVMLFSDNVTLEEEKHLKELAHVKKLLLMGPDCGTAILNGIGLCFANVVRPGRIGVIGASGTGLQEVTVSIDRLGGGVSQAIGVGGRDLQETIGGIMMLDAFAALSIDLNTDVIVIISKPPAATVAVKIQKAIETCSKPVVVYFAGASILGEAGKAIAAKTLEEAASMAVALANGQPARSDTSWQTSLAGHLQVLREGLTPHQRFVRGLFCGGTLCSEAVSILQRSLGTVYSNTGKGRQLSDIRVSTGHTCIDLGEDEFTDGRPHPMIEPSLRLPRLMAEAADPDVAVLLVDIVLGYGSHPDPAGVSAPAIQAAIQQAADANRKLVVIAYVCGTDTDRQNRTEQEKKLADAGAVLAESNARAAWLAAAIVQGREA